MDIQAFRSCDAQMAESRGSGRDESPATKALGDQPPVQIRSEKKAQVFDMNRLPVSVMDGAVGEHEDEVIFPRGGAEPEPGFGENDGAVPEIQGLVSREEPEPGADIDPGPAPPEFSGGIGDRSVAERPQQLAGERQLAGRDEDVQVLHGPQVQPGI